MSAGRSPATRAQDTMRLMTAVAVVVAVLSAAVGFVRDDAQLRAVAVAFTALALYLYARWRDVAGTGSTALLAVAVVGCAAAAAGLAATGFWWFAVCLAVPAVFGVTRLAARRTQAREGGARARPTGGRTPVSRRRSRPGAAP